MKTKTRELFNAYLDRQADLNGVSNATQKFVAAPSVEQTLESKIQESSAFLQTINVYGVTEKTGERIGMDIGTPVASTTDTTSTDRSPSDPTALVDLPYDCTKTDYDTLVTYAKLDQWAKFPDFQTRMRDLISSQQGRDRIMIGWNGTSRAATSDIGANPLLQDVNIGWMQDNRNNNAARVLTGTKIGNDELAGEDYRNVDAAVYDVVNSLIDPWYRGDAGLVVILGRDLLKDKYLELFNANELPTETTALNQMLQTKMLGGLPVTTVPYFPDKSFVVTSSRNLSLYYQEGSRRMTIVDNAKRDQIENYQSVNEAFVTEDYGMYAQVDGILSWNGSAWA